MAGGKCTNHSLWRFLHDGHDNRLHPRAFRAGMPAQSTYLAPCVPVTSLSFNAVNFSMSVDEELRVGGGGPACPVGSTTVPPESSSLSHWALYCHPSTAGGSRYSPRCGQAGGGACRIRGTQTVEPRLTRRRCRCGYGEASTQACQRLYRPDR